MKIFVKILILVLVFGIFGVARASADFSCRIDDISSFGNNETILLELPKLTNSHAGLPGSGYDYALGCADASGLSTACDKNSDILVKLSGSANAHARANTEEDYEAGADACISVSKRADIEISYRDNCEEDEKTIASMSKFPTNAHLGGPDDYADKICAKYTPPSMSGYLPSGGGGGSSSSPVASVLAPAVSLAVSTGETVKQVASASAKSVKKIVDQAISSKEVFYNEPVLVADLQEPLENKVTVKSEDLIASISSVETNPFSSNALAVGVTFVSTLALVFVGRRIFA